jgi:hypothetical protein
MPLSKCKCLYLTELNIELNTIHKQYVRICSKHSEKIFETGFDKINYRFCKKRNAYIFRGISSIKLEENILDFYDKDWYGENHINNLRSINRKNSDKLLNKNTDNACNSSEDTEDSFEDINRNKKVLFGKYSGMGFDEILEKDKNYCINIMNIESSKTEEEQQKMPSSMRALSKFIKNKFS